MDFVKVVHGFIKEKKPTNQLQGSFMKYNILTGIAFLHVLPWRERKLYNIFVAQEKIQSIYFEIFTMNLRSPSNFHYIQSLSVYIYIYFASPCSIMHVYQDYSKIEPKCLETQE